MGRGVRLPPPASRADTRAIDVRPEGSGALPPPAHAHSRTGSAQGADDIERARHRVCTTMWVGRSRGSPRDTKARRKVRLPADRQTGRQAGNQALVSQSCRATPPTTASHPHATTPTTPHPTPHPALTQQHQGGVGQEAPRGPRHGRLPHRREVSEHEQAVGGGGPTPPHPLVRPPW